MTDITGQKFGRLTAISYFGKHKDTTRSRWTFRCDCGVVKDYLRSSVTTGQTKSCGCLWQESYDKSRLKRGEAHIVHGLSRNDVYGCWRNMVQRCYNTKHISYPRYGAVGVTVCEFLKMSPQHIIDVIGERPNGKSIDRIENEFGYWCGQCPECAANKREKNIKWSTAQEQGRNRKNNSLYVWNGELMCGVELGELLGMKSHQVSRKMKHFKLPKLP